MYILSQFLIYHFFELIQKKLLTSLPASEILILKIFTQTLYKQKERLSTVLQDFL